MFPQASPDIAPKLCMEHWLMDNFFKSMIYLHLDKCMQYQQQSLLHLIPTAGAAAAAAESWGQDKFAILLKLP